MVIQEMAPIVLKPFLDAWSEGREVQRGVPCVSGSSLFPVSG